MAVILGVVMTIIIEGSLIWFLRNALKNEDQIKRVRIIIVGILAIYLTGVFVVTIGIRGFDDETKINLIPFNAIIKLVNQVVYSAKTWLGWRFYREFKYMTSGLRNLFGNILLLVPLGYLVPLIWTIIDNWKKAVLLGISASLLIEITQLLTHRGYFDIDDVILNSLGCVIGWLCYHRWLKPRKTEP